ncbi:hypothetical protein LWI28_011400 [Acer negundo]|uniref:Uncharacterized protein n=1 Tax=Acer negundo TaxID=4023 RepID=A0AAD5J492_ACENE|nr:hypothetical protein LWI28_011400 [Acer negundo]
MPNWIHEMSWWIANDIEGEKGNLFYCTIEAPESKKWENVTRISVMKNMTRNLIDAPKSPHLQTLFLYKNGLEMINGDFFQFLPFLRVLNLSKNFFLTKLPSGISNLVSLQHLDLSRTYLRELPNQLGDLKKLKCLNLEETYGLHTIPKQLISKFSMLHVLRLWDCGFMLQSTEDSVVCNDAQLLIEELLSLKNLSMLSITLNNSHALQRLLSSNRLQNCTESLYLQYLYHPKSVKVPLTDLKNLNTLNILNCVYLEEVEVDFVGETQAIRESPSRFYFLDKVIIKGCPRLWDLTWLILAPNLKSLEISDCIRMEEIINVGKLSPELMGNVIPFSKLKRLILVRLPKLRSIYWRVLPFPDVMELTIADCPMPPLPPHLLNMVNVTSVVSWTRSPIWKLRDRIKLVKKEQGSTHNQLDRSPIKGELWGEKVGGNSGVHESSIEFHRPNEYLTRIWGNIVTFNNEEVVGNLCFYTNQHRVYGPYGVYYQYPPAPIRISQEINKEKPKGAYTWSKPEVTEKSFVGEVKRDGDFKNLEKVGSRKVELSGGSRITRAIG